MLRQAGTERAFTGEYTDTETTGVYSCKACHAKLFESDTKFHSGCGWPSFYQPITDTIEYIEDVSHGMKRVEVRCANCGSHLGHVFPDGYGTPTGDRYCINSVSLTLEPRGRLTTLGSASGRRAPRPGTTTPVAVLVVGPVLQRAVVVDHVDEHVVPVDLAQAPCAPGSSPDLVGESVELGWGVLDGRLRHRRAAGSGIVS